MTVKPYPSNTVILNLDERVYTKEAKLALERSWAYMFDTLVRSHPAPENSEISNYIQVMVKFGTRKYLHSADNEADQNWTERIENHLGSSMYKIGNNNKIYNRMQRNASAGELSFDFIEFSLENDALVLKYHLDSNGDLPSDCAKIATTIRGLLNDGTFDNPTQVEIPSAESFRRQKEAAAIAKAEKEAQEKAAEQERMAQEELQRQTDEKVADELFRESPELVEEDEQEMLAEEKSPYDIDPMTEEEWEEAYGFPEIDFNVDYSMWSVSFSDGSKREFDSTSMAFLD